MQNDLTTGRPFSVLWRFSLPLLLSTGLQQVYNITDSVIVGRFTGAPGLAAVGAAYPITLFYIAVATGSAMGCSVVISQLFGAKRLQTMKTAIYTALLALSGLGLLCSALGALAAGPLLRLLNASDAIYRDARAYLVIYSLGVFPLLIYNAANGVFTGLGDSRKPLYFLIASSALNVVLDLLAVGPLGLGVAGAAWATAISMLAAAVLAVAVLVGKTLRAVEPGRRVPVFDRALLRQMARVAVPSILQQACVALAHTIVQSLVNSFSTAVVAGYEAASKLHNFCYMSFNTLGTALSAYTAQNYGARQQERVRAGFSAANRLCFGLTVLVVALLQLFPAQLMELFVDAAAEPEVIAVGVRYLRIISPDYLIICFIITYGGLFRGAGRIMDFFVLTVVDFAVRVTMCFVLVRVLNSYTGLFWAWYFGSVVDLALCVLRYRYLQSHGGLGRDLA